MSESAKPVAYVKKQGPICTAFLDPATRTPAVLSDFNEEPPGTVPQTFTSVDDCKAALAAYNVVFIERPRNPNRGRVGAVDASKIAKVLGDDSDKSVGAKTKLAAAKEAPPEVPELVKKARGFVEKLEWAHRYATEENKEVLSLKIETAQEMIEELFGRK